VVDIIDQLKLPNAEVLTAPFGQLPDLSKVRPDADLVFAWNGTTSGVRVPNADFISADRKGIVICDATSAAFAQALDWAKLDVVTFSWQKVLGGEAAHGMLILSPRAVERLESYTPPWALPKLFRMTSKGKLSRDIFDGSTINTPSMLCTEDYLDALKWASSVGGLAAMYRRADENTAVLTRWAEKTPWIDFLAEDPKTRSNTGVCLKIVDSRVTGLPPASQAEFAKKLSDLLEKEGVALDAAAYRDAPPGLRIWCGGAVEVADLEALTPWLDWAFATVADELLQAA
jgi:phosphoserine aminotransferase